jgi:hypothetical protein
MGHISSSSSEYSFLRSPFFVARKTCDLSRKTEKMMIAASAVGGYVIYIKCLSKTFIRTA